MVEIYYLREEIKRRKRNLFKAKNLVWKFKATSKEKIGIDEEIRRIVNRLEIKYSTIKRRNTNIEKSHPKRKGINPKIKRTHKIIKISYT